MIGLLLLIFWITITGANYPSQLLSDGLFWVQDRLTDVFRYFGPRLAAWHTRSRSISRIGMGGFGHAAPMAIFFPLFTLLEDLGYLPRVAFNLDKYFKNAAHAESRR